MSEKGGEAPQFDPAGENVGARLLALRQRLGLSQRELARRAKMPNGNISLIEQGKASPTIHSLNRILSSIGVSLQAFFQETPFLASPVIGEQSFVHLRADGAESWWKTFLSADHQVTLRKDRILPECTLAPIAVEGHTAGRLLGLLVEGEVVIEVKGEAFVMTSGEACMVMLNERHRFRNVSSEPAYLVTFLISP